jgi:hypothetical protein
VERNLAQAHADAVNDAITHETRVLQTLAATLEPTATALRRAVVEVEHLRGQLATAHVQILATGVHTQVLAHTVQEFNRRFATRLDKVRMLL